MLRKHQVYHWWQFCIHRNGIIPVPLRCWGHFLKANDRYTTEASDMDVSASELLIRIKMWHHRLHCLIWFATALREKSSIVWLIKYMMTYTLNNIYIFLLMFYKSFHSNKNLIIIAMLMRILKTKPAKEL